MMLLLDARREARFRDGELVLLADQDRSLWDAEQIAHGSRGAGSCVRARRSRALRHPGGDRLAPRRRTTRLGQIAALYGELSQLTGSPIVELNRAIAVAEADGPDAGLAIVDQLALNDYRYFHSTRGELLRRLSRTDDARAAFERALELTTDRAERELLERRLLELA